MELIVADLVSRQECAAILANVRQLPREAPNSMNKYGRTLPDDWARLLMKRYVVPYANAFGRIRKLTKVYGFVVEYSVDEQRSLARHIDSSTITLNLCIGSRSFRGGDVVFFNKRGRKVQIAHAVGRGIIHPGDVQHRAEPLTAGKRVNLILWCD